MTDDNDLIHDGTDPSGSSMSNGAPADSDRNSLSLSPNGPLLLHDVHLVDTLAHFNRENVPERRPHAKGSGAFGEFRVTDDVSRVHQGCGVPARRHRPNARPLLDRGRRARLARHLARRPRLLAEVLHVRGQLRPRRQQHPGVLHPRPDEVPALHPFPEAAPRLRSARRHDAVGLLDPHPRVRPPGHLPHGRPRPAAQLAQHERLRLAHLHVDQRRGRAVRG